MGFFESNTSDKAAAYLAADGVTDSVSFAITKSSEIAKAFEAEMEIVVDYWRSRHPIAVKRVQLGPIASTKFLTPMHHSLQM